MYVAAPPLELDMRSSDVAGRHSTPVPVMRVQERQSPHSSRNSAKRIIPKRRRVRVAPHLSLPAAEE